ncbi:hypothetical protein [Streptomonospora sp. PA3]|nr:hypothetical protein [Streptomonospora sp. PA3]
MDSATLNLIFAGAILLGLLLILGGFGLLMRRRSRRARRYRR